MSGLQVQGLTAADVANCSVYILDVSAELAGPAGIPTCNISNPQASRGVGRLAWRRIPADEPLLSQATAPRQVATPS